MGKSLFWEESFYFWLHLGTITTLMEEYLPLDQSFRSESIEAAYGWSGGFPTLLSLVFSDLEL